MGLVGRIGMVARFSGVAWLIGLGLSAALVLPAPAIEAGHGGEARGVRVESLARSSRSWNGDLLPPYPSGQPEVSVLRITVPAGVRLDRHHHPVINAGVLLQGRLKVVLEDGRSLVLEPGDALIEVVNRIHHGESLGPDPARILVVYAGAVGVPTSIRDLPQVAPASSAAPDTGVVQPR